MKRVIAGYLIELDRFPLFYELHCDLWEGTHKYIELVPKELMAKLTIKGTCSIYKKVRQDSRLVKRFKSLVMLYNMKPYSFFEITLTILPI